MALSPVAFTHQWFMEVWNDGDEEAIARLMAPGARFHGLGSADGQPLIGLDAFMPVYRMFRGAMPDLHIEILQTVCEGDRVAVHCHVTGTHTGPGLGIAATSAPVDFEGMAIARVVEGRIVEGWNCFDFLTMQHQVGLVQATTPSDR